MEAEQINKVLEHLTQNGRVVVDWYANWYIWASIAYMGFGGIVIYLSFWLSNKLDFEENWMIYTVRFIGLFLGAWIIFANLPDLISPYGIGTHQLIKDIRGK